MDKNAQLDYLSEKATIVPEDGLKEKLLLAEKENRPLVVKLGFDPTAPDLHLGHTVVLKKLRQYQEAGHKVVVIIGDMTAQIGDPTGKNAARPPLSEEDVKRNAQTYIEQLSKVIDVSKIEVRFNTEWLGKMDLRDTIRLLAETTLARIIERNDFKKRYESGQPISMHELVYPLLQGYDSLAIDADVEIGGTDQLFNIMMGRTIQESRGRIGQIAMCMPLLRGVDGSEKMSKSQGNHIGITASPNEMYGKIMSISDALMPEYIELVSDFTAEERAKILKALNSGENPMEVKKRLAANVVSQYHGVAAANEATDYFYRQFQAKEKTLKAYKGIKLDDLGLGATNTKLVDLCNALEPDRSKGTLRKMMIQGGVSVNDQQIKDPNFTFDNIESGTKIRIGKMGYYEIIA